MEKQGLELLLLGPLQITIAGKPVTGLVSAKAKALLAYLAVAQRPCPRSTLAGLLWSDLPEEDALRNLRVEISKLRHWLEPYLIFTRQEAMLKPGAGCRVDVQAFDGWILGLRDQIPASGTEELLKAAALYRGDFLSGFQVRAAPLFDDWLVVERERLRQSALELLDRLVEAAIQGADWKTGLWAARKSLFIDNWQEVSHRQMMMLLALSGDRSAALAQFESARRILVQELGIEPAPETLALYQRIKAGDLRPPNAPALPTQIDIPLPPHNLPAPTTSFVGRETELEQLGMLLADPGCRLLTLTGPGGVGKTRLALEFCWKLASMPAEIFQDGIYLIPLAPVNNAYLFVSTVADALMLSITGTSDPQEQLALHLRDRQMLLLLDNFEQLAEVAHILTEILQAAPGIKLLVTSRHQLNLYEEWIYPVEGMPYPLRLDQSSWEEYSAVKLFLQRARRVNLRFSREDNQTCIIRLCQLLEGLPLGIELAAAWVHVLPCEQICRLIEQNMSLPEIQTRNLPSRQRSLRAVFQYSWDLLSEDEQQSLAKVSVFQDGFTVQAAETVANTRPRLLASLAAKSLLRISPHGRYEMHTLLHDFSGEKLPALEKVAAQAAHSRYFACFLSDLSPDFAGPNETKTINQIAAEISNIRAGWEWAVASFANSPKGAELLHPEGFIDLIGQYIPVLSTFYFRKSWFREAESIFSQAAREMEAAGFNALPPATRAPFILGSVYLAWARHSRALGLNKTAYGLIEKGLPLLAIYEDSPERAEAWHIRGQIEQQTGEPAAAEIDYQHSLDIYRRLEHPTGIASNLISLGVLAKNRGDLVQAEGLYHECLDIFQLRGDQRGLWTCLINLGNIANVKQDYPEARRLYDLAYANVQHSEDQSRQALTLLNLGSVAREVDETHQALQYYHDSLRISQEIGEARIQVASLDGLGKTFMNQGDYLSAPGYLWSALRIALDANLLPQALDSLASLARLMALRQQPEQAIGILEFVIAQPACPDHVKREAEREIGRLRTAIPAGVIDQVEKAYQGLSLDAILQKLSGLDLFSAKFTLPKRSSSP